MKAEKQNVLPMLYPNAAGIDISSKEHYVAVNPQLHKESVRSFGSFTEDLLKLADWLKSCQVDTVAMEATGIYWVSLFLVLEQAGFDVVLVTAKHVKNVRGKKTDVSDAEWIRQLHSCGLLSASFQPDAFTRTLRSYTRHRKNLLEMSATHIRMIHKALEQMNIKVQYVIADITGKSGQAIIRAILKGERDAQVLASCCDRRINKSKAPDIISSLHGLWKEEHLFELEQSFQMYHHYQRQIKECDKKIEKHLSEKAAAQAPGSKGKKFVKANKNSLNFNAKAMLEQITGTNLSAIFGISDTNALELLSEVGLDMSKWPSSKHFVSWLNLAPNTKISGGKVLSSRIAKKKNHAGQIFKMAAYAVQRSKNWLAAFYQRIKYKSGSRKAIVATARKIAAIFYTMLKDKAPFNPIPIETYQQASSTRKLKALKRQALSLGFQLIEI